jgi:hypothetical protein
MEQAEVFHIYHLGEQRGPYSVRQVNHLYRCGFICDDTLYWRDGMEQWQPVTDIVERRMKRKRLRRWAITAGVLGLLAVLVFLFGPVTHDAWRELTSGEYTADSAWWRARGLVREKLSDGERVNFDVRSAANVELDGKNTATVTLAGQVTDTNSKVAHVSWTVQMQYDPERRLWQASASPAPAPAQIPAPAPASTPAEGSPLSEPAAPAGQEPPESSPRGGVTAATPSKVVVPE